MSPPFKPKMPPTGQVPADLIRLGTLHKRYGRPKTLHADQDPLMANDKDGGGPEMRASMNDVVKASMLAKDHSLGYDTVDRDVISSGNPTDDADVGRTVKETPVSTPHTVPPAPDPGDFEEYSKRFHGSPDMRLAGDFSSLNPPSNAPQLVQDARTIVRTPGIDVKTDPLRPSRRAMSADDGYYTEVIAVSDLPRIFDSLPHDYNIDTHVLSSKASIQWMDSPGLMPADIRARHMKIIVQPDEVANFPDRVIWRVCFSCNACCKALPGTSAQKLKPAVSTGDTLAQELYDYAHAVVFGDELESAGENTAAGKCGSYLMIEMTSAQSQYGMCSMRRQKLTHHPAPRPGVRRRCSPYIKRCLNDAASIFSMTKGRLKNCTQFGYRSKMMLQDQHVLWLQSDPEKLADRLPGAKDWETAMSTARNTSRVHRSPLAAIEIIAERSPENIVAFRGPRFLQNKALKSTPRKGLRSTAATPKQTSLDKEASSDAPLPQDIQQPDVKDSERMECVIAPPMARITAILQVARKGMNLDSSHRNKVAFNSPVTMLTTLNEQHHMVPLAAMVSAHADSAAYEYLLTEFERATKETARQVINGGYRPSLDGVSHEELVRQCNIFLEDGLSPRFVMIDRSDAERKAIETVLPGCPIRVCQFHMMQACRSRLRRLFGRRGNRDVLVEQTLEDIRTCQRCDEETGWDQAYETLARSVRARIPDDEEGWDILDQYLQSEWFCERWRSTVVDYALPIDVTRDGPWSTNNYVEACFRTFDRIFLCCRVNRRLDRLLLVIIEMFFPFYEFFSTGAPRPDPELQRHLFGGLHRWEVGCIHPCPISSVPAAHQGRFGQHVYCVFPPKRGAEKSSTQYCGRKKNGREMCTCEYPTHTGKRCLHLWAMIAYELLGSVFDFEENAAVIEAHLKALAIGYHPELEKDGDTSSARSTENEEDQEDFALFWGKKVEEAVENIVDGDPRMFGTAPPQPRERRSTSPSDSESDFGLFFPTVPTHSPGASDPSDPPTSRRSSTSDGDGSPIRRRFRSPATPSPCDRGPDPPTLENLSGYSLPGAPAAIKPLHPHRSQKPVAVPKQRGGKVGARIEATGRNTEKQLPSGPQQKLSKAADSPLSKQSPSTSAANARIPKRKPSTLTLPRKSRKQLDALRPLGIKNTGLDCYITALLQVIAHVDTWSNALFSDWVRERLATLPEYAILARMRDSLDGQKALEFHDLRSVLHEAGLIDSAERMGDPLDLFARLFAHLDSKGMVEVLHKAQCMRPTVHMVCAEDCVDFDHEDHPKPIMLVHPLRYDTPECDLAKMLLDSAVASNEMRLHCCSDYTTTYDNRADVLTINVVWGASPSKSGTLNVQADRRFDIPPRIVYGDVINNWTLKGVICRLGQTTSSGHYIAIVSHKDEYWKIDDHRVENVSSVSREAFKNGGYPVMIVYEKLGGGWFDPPPDIWYPSFDPTEDETTTSFEETVNAILAELEQPEAASAHPEGGSRSDPADPDITPVVTSGTAGIGENNGLILPIAPPAARVEVVATGSIESTDRQEKWVTLGSSSGVQTIIQRLISQSFWKKPGETPRQQRMIWGSPATPLHLLPRSSLFLSRSYRGKAVAEFSQSLHNAESSSSTDPLRFGLACGVPYATICADDFDRFKEVSTWFNTSICDGLCLMAERRLLRLEGQSTGAVPPGQPGVRFVRDLLPWHFRDDGHAAPLFVSRVSIDDEPIPWASLGPDSSWRKTVSVGVISTSFNAHFICLAIFGEARLVVPFDGKGGALDHPELSRRWTHLLQERLDWEMEQGFVDSGENEGWLFAPNTVELRDALQWIFQEDGNNCGALSVSAAILILQRLRPCQENLGMSSNPQYSFIQRIAILRHTLWVLAVEEASEWAVSHGRPGRLAEGENCWTWIRDLKRALRIPYDPVA